MSKRIVLLLLVAGLALALPATFTRAAEDHPVEVDPHATARTSQVGADVDHGGHEKAELLPKLDDAQTFYSALWVVIIFLALLAILYPTAWKNVLAGLKKREERIRKDIADAEAASEKAAATLKQYTAQLAEAENRVREMLSKAAADGEKLATSIRMQAQQEAEETKERSMRDIDAAKEGAINEIYQQAATLATSVAEKILRRNLNANDQRDLVNQSLDQLQTIGKK